MARNDLTITRSTQFKKDLESARKEQKDLSILKDVLTRLSHNENLENDYKIYPNSGWMSEYKTLYMQKDWILVYKISEAGDELLLARMGHPSEVF
ncbi:MAG: type II toxin-antitoxin system mRNA interferase toxin, RelE/StbE family [Planctomycetes bacterium]|nr:type II toxin-antitoxin system mRNA interferase toxin, RelE/StbE family [Planctomycetota bacterium]MCK5472732.1 type II toxin-antitoxin system mRNA interferase toxin, RelE/StbE family [Planctomycetota bacterium]